MVDKSTTTSQKFTNGLSTQVALALIVIWAMSLWNCMRIRAETWNPILLVCLVAWQTWVYTGLFINAHDAMHGSIHSSRKINQLLGQMCLWLYAGFDYPSLHAKHHLHHQYPASDRDPDFHDGETRHFWAWYGHFVSEHLSWRQLGNLMIISMIYVQICHFPIPNLVLFWVIPSLLSSIQLFYFGTFLPHREPIGGYVEPHRADTIDRPCWWSLIACYHFGYHWEHHESPQTPWWQLARRN